MAKEITRADGAVIKEGARFQSPRERVAFRVTAVGRLYAQVKYDLPSARQTRIALDELADPDRFQPRR